MKKVYLVVFVLCMMIGNVIAQTPDSRFFKTDGRYTVFSLYEYIIPSGLEKS